MAVLAGHRGRMGLQVRVPRWLAVLKLSPSLHAAPLSVDAGVVAGLVGAWAMVLVVVPGLTS